MEALALIGLILLALALGCAWDGHDDGREE
jgi:hypothetical protein